MMAIRGDQPQFDMDDDEGISNPNGQSEIDHLTDG